MATRFTMNIMYLQTCVQNYEWGKRGLSSYVAHLISKNLENKEIIKENIPYAELWMGTHSNGPSTITKLNKKLSEYIEENPKCLGEKVIAKYGYQLPYLFKVLSIDKALSIQAHPDKVLAKKLFNLRPDLYRDANHKPELAIAITSFEALCGFRPFQEIKLFFEIIPELITLIGAENINSFVTSNEAESSVALKNCFKFLMSNKPEIISQQLQLLLTRLSTLDEKSRETQLAPIIERLNEQFPNDVGCFVVYFLNYLNLCPGEAIYLGPNEPHAYLSGDCVECMACSDNVVRAGFTPKYKDVDTLCNMLSYKMETPDMKKFSPVKENEFTELFSPPIQDFAVGKIKVPENQNAIQFIPRASASIILVISGQAKCDSFSLNEGSVIFLEANKLLTVTDISVNFIAYQAFTNV